MFTFLYLYAHECVPVDVCILGTHVCLNVEMHVLSTCLYMYLHVCMLFLFLHGHIDL